MPILLSRADVLSPMRTSNPWAASTGLAARLLRMMDNQIKRSEERTRLEMHRKPWPIWDTPISEYAKPLDLDLGEHVLGKIADAKKSGVPYRVLDVGGGSFDPWGRFYFENKLAIPCPWLELMGTSLQLVYVNQNFRRFVKKCDVAGIGRKFLPEFKEHFDLVVSHAGMQNEEIIGLRELRNLTKLNGEILVVGAPGSMPKEIIETQMPYYQILASNSEWAYRLKRIA